MEYEGWICRGPMERGSYMLPVSVGCSYNRCRFCMLFKHLACRELPLEQIEKELLRVKALGGNPRRVFLGDGNAFAMDTDRLAGILSLVRRYFPQAEHFRMDATIPAVAGKSEEELRLLREMGVERLYLGIESGLEDVLAFMHKGHTLAQARIQTDRLRAAGMEYGAHIMTGVAGHGRGVENAMATAAFLNAVAPAAVINFSMFLHRRAPLYASMENGTFSPADERENLLEERCLLENLKVESLEYEGFHDCVSLRIRGRLPKDKERMCRQLDAAARSLEGKSPLYAWTE